MVWFLIGGGVCLLCVAMGIVLCFGRGTSLIAGYNTMSPKEKAQWDAKKLGASTGRFSIAAGLVVFSILLFAYNSVLWPTFVLLPALFIATIIWVIYINKNPRFRQ